MTNNDILRRLRYTFNFNDKKMAALFQSAGLDVTTQMVVNWLKKEEDANFVKCTDSQLAHFLNGLIIERRGASERKQVPEKHLNNNLILVKLKIALSLKSEDIVDLMRNTNLNVTKTELGAFLRKPGHRNFKKCHDQFLRNFLLGIDKKFNVKRPAKYIVDKKTEDKNSDIYQKSKNKFAKAKPDSRKKVVVNTEAKSADKKKRKSTLSRLSPK